MENFSEKKLLVVKYFGDVLNLATEFLVFSSILAAESYNQFQPKERPTRKWRHYRKLAEPVFFRNSVVYYHQLKIEREFTVPGVWVRELRSHAPTLCIFRY